ncbi:unnamed protein product [marine sediment metagenome]|uniref:Uncharacterized protein n=1 Tax=marine sediment metagenome TaxID=412755 RepID=X0RP94_9ZZZZ
MSRVFLKVSEKRKLEILASAKCVIGKYYKGCELIKYSYGKDKNLIRVL